MNTPKLLVDIHSHILPNLDDGSKSITETIEICKKMAELGFQKMIVTPHNQKDWFNNPPEKIVDALNKTNVALSIHRVPIILQAASEYYLDDLFISKIKAKEVLTFGNNHVLFELSPFIPDKNLFNHIELILNAGYTPVLAHPERYIYFYNQKAIYHKLIELDVKFQLNLISLSNKVSIELRNIAEYLVDNDLISFCGSDTHSLKNPLIIEELYKENNPYLNKILNMPSLLNNSLL